jgi:hypothetical protein
MVNGCPSPCIFTGGGVFRSFRAPLIQPIRNTMKTSDLGYSKAIEMPKTKLEGLQNFVQLIINKIESGENREALLTAVDLLNDLLSNANPYASVTDGTGSKLIAELQAAHAKELVEAISKAKADGIREGRLNEKQAIAQKLGLA